MKKKKKACNFSHHSANKQKYEEKKGLKMLLTRKRKIMCYHDFSMFIFFLFGCLIIGWKTENISVNYFVYVKLVPHP